MGLESVKLRCGGEVDGERGWRSDVKKTLLDIREQKSKSWKPKHTRVPRYHEAKHYLLYDV
jgi:hypothetical protein